MAHRSLRLLASPCVPGLLVTRLSPCLLFTKAFAADWKLVDRVMRAGFGYLWTQAVRETAAKALRESEVVQRMG
jgi:hypothetical protein